MPKDISHNQNLRIGLYSLFREGKDPEVPSNVIRTLGVLVVFPFPSPPGYHRRSS